MTQFALILGDFKRTKAEYVQTEEETELHRMALGKSSKLKATT